MGVFYKMESVVLIEDVCAEKGEYDSYDEYMKKTKENYKTVIIISINHAKNLNSRSKLTEVCSISSP